MKDLLYLSGTLLFFGTLLGYVRGLRRLGGASPRDRQPGLAAPGHGGGGAADAGDSADRDHARRRLEPIR
jgi:hypothetical protein